MKQFKSVLIIDDDDISNFISKSLIKQCKLSENVISYNSAVEAIDYLKRIIKTDTSVFPEMILLDINMPLMDGWEFLDSYKEIMKGLDVNVHLYILSSSVYSRDFDLASKNENVKGYIVKPLSKEKLEELNKLKIAL